jgi:hypothetical protein
VHKVSGETAGGRVSSQKELRVGSGNCYLIWVLSSTNHRTRVLKWLSFHSGRQVLLTHDVQDSLYFGIGLFKFT